jgi:hypothetical protein
MQPADKQADLRIRAEEPKHQPDLGRFHGRHEGQSGVGHLDGTSSKDGAIRTQSMTETYLSLQPHSSTRATSGQVPAGRSLRPEASQVVSSDEEDDIEMLATPTDVCNDSQQVSAKSGKWGFFRKMSMNKMRTANPTAKEDKGVLSTTVIETTGRTSTRGTRKSIKRMQSMASMLSQGDNNRPAINIRRLDKDVTVLSKRGKRRSFLPVLEGPPSLNVTIPSFSSSPFSISTLSLNTSSGSDVVLDSYAPNRAMAQRTPVLENNAYPTTSNTTASHAARYETGLKTIMSYLGDLYDLSLPVPTVQGGAEIVQNDLSQISASVSGTSETKSGASSPQIGKIYYSTGFAGTAQKVTQHNGISYAKDGSLSGPPSPVSNPDPCGGPEGYSASRPPSIARLAIEESMPTKRYKDDPVVRLGVIKHIIECVQ